MNRYPKRLIEVDLPIKRISAHARREKSIRHGHISTLHIWWARRPLAACRTVICAALWPDPADELCPVSFREAAFRIMKDFAREAMNNRTVRDELLSEMTLGKVMTINQAKGMFGPGNPNANSMLRYFLLDFIADFANWDASTDTIFLKTARALTQAAHEALGGAPGTRPLVVDPFAGGGSIPLEALRVGADAFASDLNPVAVLLNKVVLEYIPKYGQQLANEVLKWGEWIKKEAEKELAEFYPKDPDGTTPIAYLWARTIRCEGPGCGAELPLVGQIWLSQKGSDPCAFEINADATTKTIDVGIVRGLKAKPSLPISKKSSATCPLCGYVTSASSVREQLARRHGGSIDARLLAVVTTSASRSGKYYRTPSPADYSALDKAVRKLRSFEGETVGNLPLIPHESCPPYGALGFRFQKYGINRWRDLYVARQLLALTTFTRILRGSNLIKKIESDAQSKEMSNIILALLGLCLGRVNDLSASLCRWLPSLNAIAATNGGQNKMPIILDFAEANPIGGSGGDWSGQINWIARVIEHIASAGLSETGHALLAAAQQQIIPDDTAAAMITDPPYYDAFGYSDLSEFFYIWLRRTVPKEILAYEADHPPKQQEAISIGKLLPDGRGEKSDQTYQEEMTKSLDAQRRIVRPDGIGLVVFANKTTRGWEAIIESIINAGWVATASWPIDTERPNRQRAIGSAALGSSVHVVCRPRENPIGSLRVDNIGDWRDVLNELPKRIHEWMPRLAQEGVVGADAIFACLGPALEIFSRYSAVEKTSGEKVELKEYLEHVWAAVAREALNMIFQGADASGFEEDARLTAMWLWTLRTPDANGHAVEAEESDKSEEDNGNAKPTVSGYSLEYDAARKIAQGLGAHLESLGHLVEIKGETATLLPAGARTRYLFGKDATQASRPRRRNAERQLTFDFARELKDVEEEAGILPGNLSVSPGVTVLDQLHQSMILFGAGRGEALKRFLIDEGIGRNPLLWRLAQALSALYPASSEEKRWVDGVMARKKGLGL